MRDYGTKTLTLNQFLMGHLAAEGKKDRQRERKGGNVRSERKGNKLE